MNGDIAKFGAALGLDESFLKQVDLRGESAIIDRVQTVDATGAHGRFLSMVYHFGAAVISAAAQEEEMSEGPMGDAISSIARFHGVNPQLAVRLVGATWEIFRATLQNLALDEPEGEEDGGTDMAGAPAGA